MTDNYYWSLRQKKYNNNPLDWIFMNAVLTWECWVSQAIKMQPSQQSWIFLKKKKKKTSQKNLNWTKMVLKEKSKLFSFLSSKHIY